MPIYEYRCEQGHQFEVMQRITDDPLSACQTCEAPVERVYHPVAVHFKGSGFYSTDYGKRNGSRSEKEDDASSPSDKSDKKASETKDATSDKPKPDKPKPSHKAAA